MKEHNSFGLSRYIPADIKREVRRRCGFGCVVCGNAIYCYEHFDPPFAQCREHSATGITLLCGGCHNKRTIGHLSVETVRSFNKDPLAVRLGHALDAFDVNKAGFSISLGNLTAIGCQTLISVDGEQVIGVLAPEAPGAPYRLNARILDGYGKVTMEIEENEWKTPCDNWDQEVTGRVVRIWSKQDESTSLQLRVNPPSELIFEKITLRYKDIWMTASHGSPLELKTAAGHSIKTQGGVFKGCAAVVAIESGSLLLGHYCESVELRNSKISAGQFYRFDFQRNGPCPCGSGKKFKHCHGRLN